MSNHSKRNSQGIKQATKIHIASIFILLGYFPAIACASLLQFEFIGNGELYDNNFEPLNNYARIDMSLKFLLNTDQLSPINTNTYGELLQEFSFSTPVRNAVLLLDDISYSQQSADAGFGGIAVNDSLDFWENSFGISFGEHFFNTSQWIGHGTANKEVFSTGNTLLDYYDSTTNTPNGQWSFRLSSNEHIFGAFSSISIQPYSVPEPGSLILLLAGFAGITIRKWHHKQS